MVSPAMVRAAEAARPVRVGIVGMGSRGGLIASRMMGHKGLKLVAVADYFPAVAAAKAKKFGVPPKHAFSGLKGYQRMLDANLIDAIVLETPPCFFPEHAAAGVKAGCHVYMAKPVAVDVPGCLLIEKLGQASTKARKVFLVDFQTRTNEFYRESVKLIHAGAIGKIGIANSVYTDNGFVDRPLGKTIESRLTGLAWVNDISLGGGYLVNAGIHSLDVALWALKDQHPISAMGDSHIVGEKRNGDTMQVYSLTYQFQGGEIVNHWGDHVPNRTGFRSTCNVYGQHGRLESDYKGAAKTLLYGKPSYRGGKDECRYVKGIDVNLATFHKSITTGDCSNPTVAPSVNSTLATILGREAGTKGGMITWKELITTGKKIELNLAGLKE